MVLLNRFGWIQSRFGLLNRITDHPESPETLRYIQWIAHSDCRWQLLGGRFPEEKRGSGVGDPAPLPSQGRCRKKPSKGETIELFVNETTYRGETAGSILFSVSLDLIARLRAYAAEFVKTNPKTLRTTIPRRMTIAAADA